MDCYEWLFPEDVDRDKIQEMYRHSEQNKVMLQRKAEADKVVDFEQWCKERKIEPPVVEVTTSASSSWNQDLEVKGTVQSNEPIRLPPSSFTVTNLSTKNPDKEPIQITADTQTSFDYLRRPLLPGVTVTTTEEKKK